MKQALNFYKLSKEDLEAFYAVILSWVAFLVALGSPLIKLDNSYVTLNFVAFAACSFFLFYISFFIGSRRISWIKLPVRFYKLSNILLMLVIIAAVSRALDRFYMRPVEEYFSIAAVRDSKEQASNVMSIVSALLFPFALVMYKKLKDAGGYFGWAKKVVIYSSFAFALIDILLSGSRGVLLVVLVLLFYGGIKMRYLVILGPLFVMSTGLFFIYRFESLSAPVNMANYLLNISQVGYAKFVPINSSAVKEFLMQGGGAYFVFPIVQINQYMAHGIFEYAYLFSTSPEIQFDPSRVIPHLDKIYHFESVLERYNLYYTFPGTLYIAFGKMSIFAAVLFGWALGIVYRRASYVSVGAKGVVILSLFLVPFTNGIGGYDISFFLFSIFVISHFKPVMVK